MWETVDAFVKKHHMITAGDAIAAGLSGGADSICLLRYLLSVRERLSVRIFAVHVNHGLRQSADRDQAFTERFCKRWDIPLLVVKKDVEAERRRRHCSLEEAGRLVRYESFFEAAMRWGCTGIAVAHNKNDLAETMLFRLARGTGIRGLSGIAPVTKDAYPVPVLRPLLCLEREEICGILSDLGQDFVEDDTNREDRFSRNRIRLRVLPELMKINDGAVEHMAQTAGQLSELSAYLDARVEALVEKQVTAGEDSRYIRTDALLSMHPAEQKGVVFAMLAALAGGRRDLTAFHVKQILALAEKREKKRQTMPGGIVAERTAEGIRLYKEAACPGENAAISHTEGTKGEAACAQIDREELEKTGTFRVQADGRCFSFSLEFTVDKDLKKRDCTKYFDYDKINGILCLRTRRTGDYFIMNKEGNHKSLRRYFIDEKIPAGERDHVLLLAEDAHILWVVGGRISEAYKICPDTKRMLVVRSEVCPS